MYTSTERSRTFSGYRTEFRALFKSALDIHWKDHILMQAAFQKYVHASISKTINLPGSATKEDCEDALLMAWKLKLKGITLYRTGSRHKCCSLP